MHMHFCKLATSGSLGARVLLLLVGVISSASPYPLTSPRSSPQCIVYTRMRMQSEPGSAKRFAFFIIRRAAVLSSYLPSSSFIAAAAASPWSAAEFACVCIYLFFFIIAASSTPDTRKKSARITVSCSKINTRAAGPHSFSLSRLAARSKHPENLLYYNGENWFVAHIPVEKLLCVCRSLALSQNYIALGIGFIYQSHYSLNLKSWK